MSDNGLKKIERILFLILIGLAVIVIGGIILMISMTQDEGESIGNTVVEEESAEEEYAWEAGLSDSTVWLPDNCTLYEQIPDFTITDEGGKEYHISDFFGKKTVLVFWASWCEDCQEQMPNMKNYMKIASAYDDIQFIYINKTDGTKETKASAKVYFDDLELNATSYYDVDLYAYNSLGMHNIPTTFFMDEEGRIISWSPKQITDNDVFDAYISNLVKGNSVATEEFITEQLMDDDGGIHSQYGGEKGVTEKSDVLSESQGLMLLYAVQEQKQELFDQLLQYSVSNLTKDGLTAWIVTDKKASRVNALLDDFRIYQALCQAQKLWGGYDAYIEDYQKNLLDYGMDDDKYIDFYDAENKQKASRLTLCYIDLQTMKELAQQDSAFAQAYEQAKSILTEGQISEAFPLYYSWYDYDEESYQKDELNMAEAMVTLLHLAEADLLPQNTINWLKSQMSSGGIKARMNVNGEIVSGYNYDSTAVYALVALIAEEIEDNTLRGQALRKMEKMRIIDMSQPYNGAFGLEDGSEIQSFDQLLPLLVYSRLEQ